MAEDGKGKNGAIVFGAGWVATMVGMAYWSDWWAKKDKKQQGR